ncbi:MAG TPA: sigma-70 family RNA polymerase sigma factor [Myxococcota bacterium]|nr:sigma-70 family RNA polymerase sigma factor [Myxococcota bacterium]
MMDRCESELLGALQRGDERAYTELVQANTGKMLAVARRILKSDEEAYDATQEAFLQAFKAIGNFQGDAMLSTWLHRITVNACLMRLRHRKRHPETAIEDLLPQFDETGHRIESGPAWTEDVVDRLESAQLRKVVRDAIDRLPDNYRTVIVLRDIEGLSTEEAAVALGVRPEAAKMRLHRARQALRTLLAPHFAVEAE